MTLLILHITELLALARDNYNMQSYKRTYRRTYLKCHLSHDISHNTPSVSHGTL